MDVGASDGRSARQQLKFFAIWTLWDRQWDGLQQAGFGKALPAWADGAPKPASAVTITAIAASLRTIQGIS
jgi:hypothetical protein